MPSLLVIVFIIQLLIYLVNTIGAPVITDSVRSITERGSQVEAGNERHKLARRIREMGEDSANARQEDGGPKDIQVQIRGYSNGHTIYKYKRPPALSAILVLKTTNVLDTTGMGPGVCRMAIGLPKSSYGECEHTDMGDSMCECDIDGWKCGCGLSGAGAGEEERNEE
ncbi:uncharacterized protein KY384_006907 [Bacidia gigantensis]|uniref:uncharacterized protein n=1 Tax=Bacidia gigantensis TaxID=2732470 RepID=UPI001D05883A|nr:uncharacterized protein KY384_006907 [Bacidia gigantensis]KAG8527991.1 hypothetical protein KY384_006907 [Bacidia gigantensis]